MLESLNFKQNRVEELEGWLTGKGSFDQIRDNSDTVCIKTPCQHDNLSPYFDATAKKSKRLIEEVKSKPYWQINEKKCTSGKYEYYICLPNDTTINDCELDISRKELSLKLRNSKDFSDAIRVQFPRPVNSNAASARLSKTTHRLIITAPIL
uniref:PIH1_CS domain-containing protein n=1 Tax=Mesocestoides corti TaxID=53468 RepID=A0A5K3EKI6_MESCO